MSARKPTWIKAAAATKRHKAKAIRANAGPVSIEAAVTEGAEKSPAKFDVIAYTGVKLNVDGYDMPVVLDLRGMEPAKSVVGNLDHQKSQRVGHVTESINDGRQLRLRGICSAASDARDEVVGSAANGFKWQASIEAMPLDELEIVADGEVVTVNGQQLSGPFYLARKSSLYAFAFLSHGADDNTTVTIAAAAANSKGAKQMDFATWVKETLKIDLATQSEETKAALQTMFDEQMAEPSDPPAQTPPSVPVGAGRKRTNTVIVTAPAFDADDIRAGYSQHLQSIEAAFLEHDEEIEDKKKLHEIRAAATKTAKALKAKAVKEQWSADKFELESVRAANVTQLALIQAKAPAGPAIHSAHRDVSEQVVEAALCRTLNLPNREKQFKEQDLEQADKYYKHLGLQQTMIMCAVANGYHCRAGERLSKSNHRDILRYCFAPVHAGPSTLSLPGILNNVANKELLLAYESGNQEWREIAAVKSVNDFKEVTSYRLLDNFKYERVGQDGKIHHGTVGEESYTRQVHTYAKMFCLTREDQRNDNIGAFDDLRTRMGLGGLQAFLDIFWQTFMSNSAFYTAGRGNYITGATTNLGLDGVGLQAAVLAFRQLKTPKKDGNKRLAGRPEILLVPPELETIADLLYTSRNVNTGGASTATSVPNDNTHAGKYKPVCCNWLSDDEFTGHSSTAFYLLGNPALRPAMVASFLDGQESPTVETADANFDTLGIDMRGFHDFGCDQAEYLAGVKSKGAA